MGIDDRNVEKLTDDQPMKCDLLRHGYDFEIFVVHKSTFGELQKALLGTDAIPYPNPGEKISFNSKTGFRIEDDRGNLSDKP